jgi:hypothetical protein
MWMCYATHYQQPATETMRQIQQRMAGVFSRRAPMHLDRQAVSIKVYSDFRARRFNERGRPDIQDGDVKFACTAKEGHCIADGARRGRAFIPSD